jgi:hypothetical protein
MVVEPVETARPPLLTPQRTILKVLMALLPGATVYT